MSTDVSALASTVLASPRLGWMWLLGGLMIVVWLAILGILGWIASLPAGRNPTPPAEQSRKALAERFLRGELDAQEYYDRLDELERRAEEPADSDRAHA